MPVIVQIKYYNTYLLKRLSKAAEPSYNWYVEESRIRGGYNNTQTGLAPRAFLVSEDNLQQSLGNSIIYSGVFNSRTGTNQSNVFPSGQDITRSVDPGKGTIQKLYAENTNLTIFQERKVNRALIDKDAIYSAEGQPMTTSSNLVIGQIQPYAGNFGIATNPESFAVYGYRKYFTDAAQGAVLRLSQDGLTEISNYGMYDYFRDKLGVLSSGDALGSWDIHQKSYVLSLQPSSDGKSQLYENETLYFDEKINGWSGRMSFVPCDMFSVQNKFLTSYYEEGSNHNGIYEHYSTAVNRGNFYSTQYDSTITSVFNKMPSLIKTFQTINYEGGENWSMESFVTNGTGEAPNTNQYTNEDSANEVTPYIMPTTLAQLETNYLKNEFKKKEDKYFANLINTTAFTQGEVIYGGNVSGVKGYFATVKMSAKNSATSGSNELFAISTNYKESSY